MFLLLFDVCSSLIDSLSLFSLMLLYIFFSRCWFVRNTMFISCQIMDSKNQLHWSRTKQHGISRYLASIPFGSEEIFCMCHILIIIAWFPMRKRKKKTPDELLFKMIVNCSYSFFFLIVNCFWFLLKKIS